MWEAISAWSKTGIALDLSFRKGSDSLSQNEALILPRKRCSPCQLDAVIVGGGPAGTSAAISLARWGYTVVLLEKSDYNTIRFGETLQPEARELLMHLGVWEQFVSDNPLQSFGIQSAWGQDALHENNFMLNPFGHGWHLNRVRFDAMLAHAAAKAGAWVLQGSQIIRCFESAKGEWHCTVLIKNKPHRFRARFLVDATGRSCFIARKKGAKRILSDHLIGVVAFFQTDAQTNPHQGYTLIEAQENGWWYSAELPEHKTALVWMTDADIYARAIRRSPDFWQEQLNTSTYTKARIVASSPISNPKPVASHSSRIDPVAGDHWLAVGDAAMSFDPLSSQGIYKAMKSGIHAAKLMHHQFMNQKNRLESYAHAVDEGFEKYLRLRRLYYLKEQRWPPSLFWQRRHVLPKP